MCGGVKLGCGARVCGGWGGHVSSVTLPHGVLRALVTPMLALAPTCANAALANAALGGPSVFVARANWIRQPLHRRPTFRRGLVLLDAGRASEPASSLGQSEGAVTVSTFNLLCPAYRRLPGEPDTVREAEFPDQYTKRHRRILQLPMWSRSDIVCAQEFWYSSSTVRARKRSVRTARRRAAQPP